MANIKAIYRYPIKSLRGERVANATMDHYGIEYDRHWMIVDKHGAFLTQREWPNMTRLSAAVSDEQIHITDKRDGDIFSIPIDTIENTRLQTTVWDDAVSVNRVDRVVDKWLSERLDKEVKLVTHGKSFRRQKIYNGRGLALRFADGYPLLVLSQASIDLLNKKLERQLSVNRFRPNILINDCEAHQEDTAKQYESPNGIIYAANPCKRCIMVNTDQESGIVGKEPLRTLSTYRRSEDHVIFGINAYVKSAFDIGEGDSLTIIE